MLHNSNFVIFRELTKQGRTVHKTVTERQNDSQSDKDRHKERNKQTK